MNKYQVVYTVYGVSTVFITQQAYVSEEEFTADPYNEGRTFVELYVHPDVFEDEYLQLGNIHALQKSI